MDVYNKLLSKQCYYDYVFVDSITTLVFMFSIRIYIRIYERTQHTHATRNLFMQWEIDQATTT